MKLKNITKNIEYLMIIKLEKCGIFIKIKIKEFKK
jgi:hypothetical protein